MEAARRRRLETMHSPLPLSRIKHEQAENARMRGQASGCEPQQCAKPRVTVQHEDEEWAEAMDHNEHKHVGIREMKNLRNHAEPSPSLFGPAHQFCLGKSDVDDVDDYLYAKVHHVQWERDIIWDIGLSTSNQQKKIGAHEQGAQLYRNAENDRNSTTPIRSHLWDLPERFTNERCEDPRGSTISLPFPVNSELNSGMWIQAIGWNSAREMPPSKLILDESDGGLILAVPGADDHQPALRIPERKVTESELQKTQQELDAHAKRDRTNRVFHQTKLGAESHGTSRPSGSSTPKKMKVVLNAEALHHSVLASSLSSTSPELSKAKLRAFHRPRSNFKTNERILFKQPPTHASPSKRDAAGMKKLSDLQRPASDHIFLLEYSEQNPPILSNPGMAARLLHYWRPPTHEDQSGMEHTLDSPKRSIGQVITLEENERPPFLGDVPPGRVVSSLNSSLYRVPIFPQMPVAPFSPLSSTTSGGNEYELFLLCRSSKRTQKHLTNPGEEAESKMHIYEIPDVYIAGQVEPQMEVPAPNSTHAKTFLRPFMLLHILRMFRRTKSDGRLKFDEVACAFPSQSSTSIRKRLKEVANFERSGSASGWWKKKQTSELPTEEYLLAQLSPEAVCLYESMLAGRQRLTGAGLNVLLLPLGVSDAVSMLESGLERRKRALSGAFSDASKVSHHLDVKKAYGHDSMCRRFEMDIRVARFINDELELTPWNLTKNFVECHLQENGSGKLMLSGHGDPTARGEGFSFVRAPQARGMQKRGKNVSAIAPTSNMLLSSISGTRADLRKLKMKEAGQVLRKLGISDADIKKLRRWDRIHLIREYSGAVTKYGQLRALAKFVRNSRKSNLMRQCEYRQRCDEIFQRQMDVLSSTTTTFSEEEESGDDDFDGISEVEQDIIDSGFQGMVISDSSLTGMRDRSKKILADREDALELERLRRDMDQSLKTIPRIPLSRLSSVQIQSSLGTSDPLETPLLQATGLLSEGSPRSIHQAPKQREHIYSTSFQPNHPSSRRKALKRTTRVVHGDGSESLCVEFIVDERQIANHIARKQSCPSLSEVSRKRKLKDYLAGEAYTSKRCTQQKM